MKSADWKDFKRLVEYPKEGILSKEIFKDGKVDVTLFCMAKGSELSEHTSTKEGLIMIVDGRGIFVLEGKKITVKPGITIRMKKNAKHALKAKEKTSFLLVLFN